MDILVHAIHPQDPKASVRPAFFAPHHFGRGNHAIHFGGINPPHFPIADLVWEPASDTDRIEIEIHSQEAMPHEQP